MRVTHWFALLLVSAAGRPDDAGQNLARHGRLRAGSPNNMSGIAVPSRMCPTSLDFGYIKP